MSATTNVQPPADPIQPSKPQVQADLSPLEIAQAVGAITTGLADSLRALDNDKNPSSNLIAPGKISLSSGCLMLIAAVCCRVLARFLADFKAPEFMAMLGAGCLLYLTGVFLLLYQYRTEQAKAAAVVKITEGATMGLVGKRGPL
jgi:hypothetical protein